MRTFNMNEKTYPVWKNGKGYACVSITENGYDKAFLLHRLVWELEHGPVPSGYELHHIDHDKGNWRLDNLMMMDRQTHQELHRQHRRSTDIYHKAGNENGRRNNPDRSK
jgi:hypothetical protein